MFTQAARRGARMLSALALAAVVLTPAAQATKLKVRNLTQLISESQSIIAGTVTAVTDGIDDNGIPYTEVTVAVTGSAKGGHEDGSEYTFRQFGLLAPRSGQDGLQYLAVAPAGFPRWHEGESVIAFLHEPAATTGLQTTSGLAQGKLSLVNGRLANEFDNLGLFDGVEIDDDLLTPAERDMLTTPGPVDAATFMQLVDRAVSEGWIENGEMH